MNAPSARGLFRATGKNSKPAAVRAGADLGGDFARAEFLPRESHDFYPTPADVTRSILLAERSRLFDFPLIWEPAAGDGAMVREMRAIGLKVHGSDLIDRGAGFEIKDFFAFTSAPAPAIVTNPPFAPCNQDPGWIRHAMGRLGAEYMALLLPVTWTGAAGRAALWADYPPARIYIMRWRIDFTGQGASPVTNSWVVWDRQHQGETVLRMLDRKDARQFELLDGAA